LSGTSVCQGGTQSGTGTHESFSVLGRDWHSLTRVQSLFAAWCHDVAASVNAMHSYPQTHKKSAISVLQQSGRYSKTSINDFFKLLAVDHPLTDRDIKASEYGWGRGGDGASLVVAHHFSGPIHQLKIVGHRKENTFLRFISNIVLKMQ